MHVAHIVGARPNFMKVAPVLRAFEQHSSVRQTLIHTGQHYDSNMSDVFFSQLGIRHPDIHLNVGPGTQITQAAEIMTKLEKAFSESRPDLTLVYGDVTSTVAGAFVCAKNGIRVGHVEAGLRSRDRTMPEELNRLVTDQLSNALFTPSRDGDENLIREGVAPERIHFVGNVMIDTLIHLLPKAAMPAGVDSAKYILVTLHRPSNVDDASTLDAIMQALVEISQKIQVIFPVHPRTRQKLSASGAVPGANISLLAPLGYLEFLALQQNAKAVVTDSGGIQEETTYLGVPCLTLRENTERPITVDVGTNKLIGRDLGRLRQEVELILRGEYKTGKLPELWDGRAGERIAKIVADGRIA